MAASANPCAITEHRVQSEASPHFMETVCASQTHGDIHCRQSKQQTDACC